MKRSGLLLFSLVALAGRAHADERKLSAFDGIELSGMMAMEVSIGATAKVDVQGEPDLAKLVSTTVKNGTLIVETPEDFSKKLDGRKSNKLKVVVTMPSLARVSISGTGAIDVTGLAQPSVDASIPGTGSLKLAGKADRLRLNVQGTGAVKAKSLIARDVEVSVQGTAEASVHASKSFVGNVMGTAMVKVHGKPGSVRKNVQGTAMIDVD
ncbi:MAG TPA: head GIN domain-containing protein [Kofleriaceae bacterium]|nr:head GIN domain-containing protein [Kofleriaceae bacterium]